MCPSEIEERLRDSTTGSPAEDGSTSGVSSGEPDETDRRETRDDIQPEIVILNCGEGQITLCHCRRKSLGSQ